MSSDEEEGQYSDNENEQFEGEDLDGDEEDDFDEDDQPSRSSKNGSSNKKGRRHHVDDDDDEDDDEPGRPRKRQRAANMFLDVEAAVDEDEDEEEVEDEEEAGFIDREDHVEGDAEEYLSVNARSQRDVDRRFTEQSDAALAEIAADMDRRYKKSASAARRFVESGSAPQHLLVPAAQGPKLWMIRCKPGKEKDIVFNLMRKYFDREYSAAPLKLHSVFCRDDLKGYVYIEADVPAHVQEALDKMNGLYMSKMTLVPVKEMPDTLTINKKDEASSILEGGWVRIRRGKYANDLAQVLQTSDTGDLVTVRLVPRLDMTPSDRPTLSKNATEEQKKKYKDEERKRRKDAPRPPQKLFSERELPPALRRMAAPARGGGWTYYGETYRRGYLEKEVRVSSLITSGVTPTLDEITNFTGEADGGLDASVLMSLKSNGAAQDSARPVRFQPGEAVEITSGELARVHGIVESVTNDLATIVPRVPGLRDKLTIPLAQLQKRFNIGDHVKVVQGKHKDETGMILNITDNTATLFSDISSTEIKVFIRDLSDAGDISAPTMAMSVSKYDLHDLVVFDNNVYGVVVRIDQDVYQVLDVTNTVRTVRYNQIRTKRDSRNSLATDSENNTVAPGELVRTVDNARQGTILHIHRNAVWLQCRDMPENAGIFATSSSRLVCMTERARPKPTSGYGRGAGGFGAPAPPAGAAPVGRGRGRRDPLVGNIVKISGGAYKGYMGVIKDATDAMARVELHTNSRVVNIERNKLLLRDSMGNFVSQHGPGSYSGMGSTTSGSLYGASYTPSMSRGPGAGTTPYGGATSGRTPAYGSGARTPAWSSDSRTPNPYGSAQTPNPYANDGSRTPAWDAGSRTPGYTGGSGGDSAWGVGSRTPGRFESGETYTPRRETSGTPSWEGGSSGMWSNGVGRSTPSWGSSGASATGNWGGGTSSSRSSWDSGMTPNYTGSGGGGDRHRPSTSSYSTGVSTPGHNAYGGVQAGGASTPARSHSNAHRDEDEEKAEKKVILPDNWITPGIEVRVGPHQWAKEVFQNGRYDNQTGVITRLVNSRRAEVRIGGQPIEIAADFLLPVPPNVRDNLLVLNGQYKGKAGTLIGYDKQTGIVKLTDLGSEYKMVHINHLARVPGGH
ncbi:transcription elongation factor spt5 [Sorochytrium milnesiophthora]